MKDPIKFLTEWKAPEASMSVVIRKAVILGLIESQDGIFMINKSPIGSNINSLVVYLKDNEKYYEYLKTAVAGKDTLPYDVVTDISVSEALEKQAPKERKDTTLSAEVKAVNKEVRDSGKKEAYDRAQSQKNRLRELKVAGWPASEAWSEEVRLQKISDAEALLKNTAVVAA